MSDAADHLTGLLAAAAVVVSSVVSAAVTFVVTRRPAKVTAEAAWQTAMNQGFKELTAQYEARNAELLEHVSALEGGVAGLSQHLYSLEKILRDLGHPIPERPVHAVWPPPEFKVLKGGKS